MDDANSDPKRHFINGVINKLFPENVTLVRPEIGPLVGSILKISIGSTILMLVRFIFKMPTRIGVYPLVTCIVKL